jgi:hypothetical protein
MGEGYYGGQDQTPVSQVFAAETAELREQARRNEARLDWIGGTTFKAIFVEGLKSCSS